MFIITLKSLIWYNKKLGDQTLTFAWDDPSLCLCFSIIINSVSFLSQKYPSSDNKL